MRTIARLAFTVALVGCAVSPPPGRANVAFAVAMVDDAPAPRAESAIVVAIDGARWQEVFSSDVIMPTLRRWMTIDGASIGAPGHGEIRASGPNYVSLPGYMEIFSGQPSACHSNDCGPIDEPTIVDEVIDGGGSAAVISSWETLVRAAARTPARAMVSAGRERLTHADAFDFPTFEAGERGGPGPGLGEYRRDEHTIRLALDFAASHEPKFLFVGLGDTDEHAHRDDRVGYVASLRTADAFLAELEARVSPRTVIFVTADHGRDPNFRDHGETPESGRVWLVAKGAGISARGALDTKLQHLADIAPTIRCLLGMPRIVSPNGGEAIAKLCPSEP